LHTKALDLHGGFNNLSRPKAVWTNKAVLYLLTRKGGLGEQSRFIKWSFCGEFINLYLQ
jgi:hypothetical protein